MKKTFSLFVLLLLFATASFPQNDSLIYGLNFAGSQLRFTRANIYTGQTDLVNTTPTGSEPFGHGVADLDPYGERYFYIAQGKVFTVDMQTGNVLHSPTITCTTQPLMGTLPITNIAYNFLDSTLYGLHHLGSDLRFAKVDPVTGVMTILSPGVIAPEGYFSGVSDLDPYSRRYYFLRTGRILTVDLDSGAVLNNVPLSNPNNAVAAITNIAYNYITNRIYGINYAYVNNTTELRLAMVDPDSGNVTIISPNVVSSQGYLSGVSDIQPASNLYTFTVGSNNSMEIISVDLSTGIAVHRPLATNPNGALLPITNFAYQKLPEFIPSPAAVFQFTSDGLSVEMKDQSRFARHYHWDFGDGTTHTAQFPSHTYTNPGTYPVTLIVENASGSDTIQHTLTVGTTDRAPEDALRFAVYPNPTSDHWNLEFPQNQQGQLVVINATGQVMLETVLSGGVEYRVDATKWAAGVYNIQVRTKQGIAAKKVVKWE